jgi:hypothetical protein
MSEALEKALEPFLASGCEVTVQVATRVLERVRSSVENELTQSERRAGEAAGHKRHVAQRACESAQRALETFLAQNDLPDTELGLRLEFAAEQGPSGEIQVRSPFGVSARFVLRLPANHPWTRPRRVVDLEASGLEVHLPQPSGWISRRVEMAPVKLDRLFVSTVKISGCHVELLLRKSPGAGSGYRIVADLRGESGSLIELLGESGPPSSEPPLSLQGEDHRRSLALCRTVIESMQGLANLRGKLLELKLDEQPLQEREWPEQVAARILSQVAPVLSEISRRSGAPGELVLRRDMGGGRREEVYLSKAELWEKVLVLPPERRAPFAALGLAPTPPLREMLEPLPAAPALRPLPPLPTFPVSALASPEPAV